MEKKILFTSFLSCIFLFASCSDLSSNNSPYSHVDTNSDKTLSDNSSTFKESDTTLSSDNNPFLLATGPGEFVFRNSKYIEAPNNLLKIEKSDLDEVIAYIINQCDYEKLYSEDPDVEYCLYESNSLYYAYGTPKFPIYSIKNHDVEKIIAVAIPNYEDAAGLYMNVELIL